MLAFIAVIALSASPCAAVQVVAELVPEARLVRGEVRCEVAIAGELSLATYPRLLREAVGLDDVRLTWFYPAGFDAADQRLWVEDRELTGDGAWVSLGHRHAGERVTVRFQTRVPERNGTLGYRDGAYYLLGGWYPAFGRLGELSPVATHFDLRVPSGTVGLAGSTPFGLDSPRRLRGQMWARFVPWVVAPGAFVEVLQQAVIVQPAQRSWRPRMDEPRYGLRDLSASFDELTRDDIGETLEAGAAAAARHGLRTPPLLVVVAPLREHTVEVFDGGIAVSDRAFHGPRDEFFKKFHRMGIWRSQLFTYALAHARLREVGPWVELAADATACALRDELVAETYGGIEYAPDVLEPVAIIPEIDALIFAPQIPFVDAYYEAIDESPMARLHLDDFWHAFPKGKLLYEKLSDHTTREGALAMTAQYLGTRRAWLDVAKQALPGSDASLLGQWLPGPYPRVDYALGDAQVGPTGLSLELEVYGPDASRVREPVTVEVVDAQGVRHRAKRLGAGELTFPGVDGAEVVSLDPEHRLVELWHEPGVGPHWNNRDPPRWRFLLNNINGLFAVTNKQVSASADFTLRRIHDLTHRLGFVGYYTPTGYGAAASASYAFGKEITALSLAQSVGIGLGVSRLTAETVSDEGRSAPGQQLSLSVGYGYDDRLNPYYSFSGKGLSATLGAALGGDDDGEHYQFGSASLSGFYIVPVASGHALVGRLRGDLIIGERPPQTGVRLGGRYLGGRGYEIDEARGDERIIASLEYRHLLEGDARTDVLRLVTWTRIEGAFFADALYFPVRRSGCHQDYFYDAGYALRFMGDIFNVYTSSLGVDFGVPINRCPDERDRLPFTIYGSFIQSFSTF